MVLSTFPQQNTFQWQGQTDGRTDGWTDGRTDGLTEGPADSRGGKKPKVLKNTKSSQMHPNILKSGPILKVMCRLVGGEGSQLLPAKTLLFAPALAHFDLILSDGWS